MPKKPYVPPRQIGNYEQGDLFDVSEFRINSRLSFTLDAPTLDEIYWWIGFFQEVILEIVRLPNGAIRFLLRDE